MRLFNRIFGDAFSDFRRYFSTSSRDKLSASFFSSFAISFSSFSFSLSSCFNRSFVLVVIIPSCNATKRYVYLANGNSLVYKFGSRNRATAIVRAKTTRAGFYRQIFESKDASGSILGLYCDTDNILYIDYEGTKIKTDLEFKANQWHTVGLSFRERVENNLILSSGVARKPVLALIVELPFAFCICSAFACHRASTVAAKQFESQQIRSRFISSPRFVASKTNLNIVNDFFRYNSRIYIVVNNSVYFAYS